MAVREKVGVQRAYGVGERYVLNPEPGVQAAQVGVVAARTAQYMSVHR